MNRRGMWILATGALLMLGAYAYVFMRPDTDIGFGLLFAPLPILVALFVLFLRLAKRDREEQRRTGRAERLFGAGAGAVLALGGILWGRWQDARVAAGRPPVDVPVWLPLALILLLAAALVVVRRLQRQGQDKAR